MAVAPTSTANSPNKEVNKEVNKEAKSKKGNLSSPNKPAVKRTKNPGVRIIGGRIYDSEHGKTCHQCRQKTRDFVAPCKGTRKGKPCTINYCHKCLLNRYGEKAEEVTMLENWSCPKCRGVCNCSFCMKKKGQKPTGLLIATAKKIGFSSVLELLDHKNSNDINAEEGVLPGSKIECGSLAEGSDKNEELVAKMGKTIPSKKVKRESCSEDAKETKVDIIKRKVSEENGNGHAKEEDTINGNFSGEDGNGDIQEKKEIHEGKDSGGATTNITKKERLLHGKKRQVSISAGSDNMEGRPQKARKLKKHKTSNVPGDELLLDDCEQTKLDAEDESMVTNFKTRKLGVKGHLSEIKSQDVVLPQGIPLTMVADTELPDDDVGPALQFLEFCNAFSKVLDINKGQAEAILRELARGRIGRRGVNASLVHFHVKLLSVIQEDMGEKSPSYSLSSGNSWLQALGKCIGKAQWYMKELPSDCFIEGSFQYDNLDKSTKLRILNFLCDESLGTEKLRNWIDKENMKFIERNKEVDEKVLAAKRKEKDVKQKLKDEMAKSMLSLRDGGALLSISEHDKLIAKIRAETEKAHDEMLESISCLPKKKQRRDAVRTQPMLLKGSGHAYWKLTSYCNSSNILFQDIENWNSMNLRDKWFIFDEDDEKVVEKHISSLRCPKNRELVRN